MEERKKRGIVRHDMVNILMQVRQGQLSVEAASEQVPDAGFATVDESEIGRKASTRKWTDKELIAQVTLIDGI